MKSSSRFFLPQEQRLRKWEIKKLFEQGIRVKHQNYLGIYLFNQKSIPRLAITLKKKLEMQL